MNSYSNIIIKSLFNLGDSLAVSLYVGQESNKSKDTQSINKTT